VDFPYAIPIWVDLPHFPLHYWGDDVLRIFIDSMWKYIDKSKPKLAMYACPKICVKMDLEEGLTKDIFLTVDGWSHIQKNNYELLPFNYRICHDYGNFVKIFKKKPNKVKYGNKRRILGGKGYSQNP